MTNALSAGDIDIITSLQSPDALATFRALRLLFRGLEGTSTKELLAFNDAQGPALTTRVPGHLLGHHRPRAPRVHLGARRGSADRMSMVSPSDPWYTRPDLHRPLPLQRSRNSEDQHTLAPLRPGG